MHRWLRRVRRLPGSFGVERRGVGNLLCLEKKNLVSIDYSAPLKGFSYAGYEKYPVKGSVALTNRGQQVLDLLEKQGIQE